MVFSFHPPRHADGNYCVRPADMRAWEGAEIEAVLGRGHELMEIAGREVAMRVLEKYADTREVLVFCGPGNNGGDGLVAASYLKRCGIAVTVFAFDDETKNRADARHCCESSMVIRSAEGLADVRASARRRDIVAIDAIYGTGFHASRNALMAQVCEAIAALECPVVSVDVPSGIDALTGRRGIYGSDASEPQAVVATDTVTFGAPKFGHFLGDGPGCCGDLVCADIGLLDWPAALSRMRVLSDALCARAYGRAFERAHDVHKGRCGHVVVIGGHVTMPGASSLAARAALRTGAGKVSIGARHAFRAPDEIMMRELCPFNAGLETGWLAMLVESADCLVVGPGLGRDPQSTRVLMEIDEFRGSLVLDADALWALSRLDRTFASSEIVLTPHPGEAALLLGCSVSDILEDPVSSAQKIMEKYRATVILKSHATVISSPGESGQPARLAVLPYPNPSIATAGAGDVLAGMVGGLIAQCRCGATARKLDTFDLAAIAVNAHSAAGRRAAEKLGNAACASDIIAEIHT